MALMADVLLTRCLENDELANVSRIARRQHFSDAKSAGGEQFERRAISIIVSRHSSDSIFASLCRGIQILKFLQGAIQAFELVNQLNSQLGIMIHIVSEARRVEQIPLDDPEALRRFRHSANMDPAKEIVIHFAAAIPFAMKCSTRNKGQSVCFHCDKG
jgi:hypothetical protein